MNKIEQNLIHYQGFLNKIELKKKLYDIHTNAIHKLSYNKL